MTAWNSCLIIYKQNGGGSYDTPGTINGSNFINLPSYNYGSGTFTLFYAYVPAKGENQQFTNSYNNGGGSGNQPATNQVATLYWKTTRPAAQAYTDNGTKNEAANDPTVNWAGSPAWAAGNTQGVRKFTLTNAPNYSHLWISFTIGLNSNQPSATVWNFVTQAWETPIGFAAYGTNAIGAYTACCGGLLDVSKYVGAGNVMYFRLGGTLASFGAPTILYGDMNPQD